MLIRLLKNSVFVLFVIDRISINFKYKKDKATSRLSNVLYLVASLTYISLIVSSYVETALKNNINFFISLAGGIVFIFGITFRNLAIKEMGVNWSFHLEPKPESMLITHGIYKHITHPYYLGVMLELIGFSLLFNSLRTFIFIFILQLPIILVRISFEERFLIHRHGKRYDVYRKFPEDA